MPLRITEADIENSYYAAVINLLFEATVSKNSIADYELLMTAAVIRQQLSGKLYNRQRENTAAPRKSIIG